MAVEERITEGARPDGGTPDVLVERLTKRFDDVAAVDDISLEIQAGHFFALLGPSGAARRRRSE